MPAYTRLPGLAARICTLLLLTWLVVALRPGGVVSSFSLPSPWASAAALTAAADAALSATSIHGPEVERSLADAKRLAGEALLASPLASDAVRILGLVAEREGRDATARHLVEVAAMRSARDLKGRAWLMMERLRVADYSSALAHLTALSRVSGAAGAQLYPVLQAVAAQSEGREALADLLAVSPPWRTPFLRRLAVSDEPAETSIQLLSLLAKRGARSLPEEYAPVTRRLVSEGRVELAYLLWLESQTPDRLGRIGNINNGDFEHQPDGSPFDWTLTPAEGVWIGFAARPEHGKQLRIVFNESEGSFEHVSQKLMLAPGEYELSSAARSENLDTKRGLWWRVLCGGGTVIGTTDPVLGNTPGTLVRARLKVPRTGCPVQTLRLELAARGTFETRISGEVWFDDVQIKRVVAPAQ